MQSKAQAATNTQGQQVDGLEKSELARIHGIDNGWDQPKAILGKGSLEASRRRQGRHARIVVPPCPRRMTSAYLISLEAILEVLVPTFPPELN